ncbi:MAG: gamma-glutamylcyclotransferase family protein [Marinoscillum sp.]
MSDYLFAYGFLKRRFHGNTKTQTPAFEAEFVSDGWYKGLIYRVDIYPGVIPADDGSKVKGEVFRLKSPEIALKILDKYENSRPLVILNPDYERVIRPIETSSGVVNCWVYEYLKPVNPATLISSGEF